MPENEQVEMAAWDLEAYSWSLITIHQSFRFLLLKGDDGKRL
jgi:hypothetical protein